MKKITLFVVICLMNSSLLIAYLLPKWADKDIWRHRLKKGMTEYAAINLLGRPQYIVRGSGSAIMYYDVCPVTKKDKHGKKTTKYIENGIVFLDSDISEYRMVGRHQSPPPERPKYFVKRWAEPYYEKIKPIDPNSVNSLKMIRKPELWERPEQWNKLAVHLGKKAVYRILGEPAREEQGEQEATAYYYGNKNYGFLIFKNFNGQEILSRWMEPFWPEIEQTLHPANSICSF